MLDIKIGDEVLVFCKIRIYAIHTPLWHVEKLLSTLPGSIGIPRLIAKCGRIGGSVLDDYVTFSVVV